MNIVNCKQKVKLQNGDKLECQAEGYPAPSYSWTRNPALNDLLTENEITVTEEGAYTCTASNGYKNDSCQTDVSFNVISGRLNGCSPT